MTAARFATAAAILALSIACEEPAPVEQPETGESGRVARRISEGCEPVEASLEYEDHVGERALAILSWTRMSEQAANLEIPVYVAGIEDGAIAVGFLDFPMREQYLNIWLGSGHIRAAGENVFWLDPCSARLEPWPVPRREPPTE